MRPTTTPITAIPSLILVGEFRLVEDFVVERRVVADQTDIAFESALYAADQETIVDAEDGRLWMRRTRGS